MWTGRPDADTGGMTGASELQVLTTLLFVSAMLLAGVKKRALQFRGTRHCVVCKQPMRRCRCR